MKKVKKSENENRTSTECEIASALVKSTSETGCLLRGIDELSSSEVDQEERR
jgi:hypothetical protein